MQWQRTGTVTVTNGSATVTGASTLWSDVGTLNPGDIFNGPDGKLYEILTINSNTGITLNSVYLGSSLSGQAYSIMPIGLLPSTLAQQVKTTLATANTAMASTVRYDISTMGLSLTQQQNARTNIAALSALDVGQGYLNKSVAGGVDVTLTAVEASNQMIALTGSITANINVIVPVAQRLFFIQNSTSGAFVVTVKTLSGPGIQIAQGSRMMLTSDSTNVVNPLFSALTVPNNQGLLWLNSSGTAAQILRLNSSNNVEFGDSITSASAMVLASGNLGLGVTPSAWGSNWKAQQIGGLTTLANSSANGFTMLGNNAYASANNTWNYLSTNPASMYLQALDGTHRFYNAPSGTAGNPITFTQAMTLDAGGNLVVGHGAYNDGYAHTLVIGAASYQMIGHSSTTTGTDYVRFGYNASVIGAITQNGTTAVAYNTTSDHRLKTNVRDANAARFMDIQFRDFEWVDGRHDCGVIAHELQAVYPDLVMGAKDATEVRSVEITTAVAAVVDAEGVEITPAVAAVTEDQTFPVYQQVNYTGLICRMGVTIQKQQALIESLTARLTSANIA